jgi:LytS/YehU family sensor histidine kinase
LLEVIDNGPGSSVNAEDLAAGVGLSNTQKRLQGLYGPAHSFEARNLSSGGFSVRLRIPIEETAVPETATAGPKT